MPKTSNRKNKSNTKTKIEKYPKPLLKWVGGKNQILEDILALIPSEIENYYEPFLGGGSVLFGILQNIKKNEISISQEIYAYDSNPYLISLYQNLQKEPIKFYEAVKSLKEKMNSIKTLNEKNRDLLKARIKFLNLEKYQEYIKPARKKKLEEAEYVIGSLSEAEINSSREMFYYYIRRNFNEMSPEEKSSIVGSAHFLFLNKTCFRGLYRISVNQDLKSNLQKEFYDSLSWEQVNYFNVPYGNYKKPEIITLPHVKEISKLVENVKFDCLMFEESLAQIKKNDFVYLDPPYVPEKEQSFVKYTEDGFPLEKHKTLFGTVKKMKNKFLLSNSKVKLVTDTFKSAKYHKQEMKCKRAINSKNPNATTRELLIHNYSL